MLHDRCGQGSEYASDFKYQYSRVWNIPSLLICWGSEYASGSEYGRVLDIPQF